MMNRHRIDRLPYISSQIELNCLLLITFFLIINTLDNRNFNLKRFFRCIFHVFRLIFNKYKSSEFWEYLILNRNVGNLLEIVDIILAVVDLFLNLEFIIDSVIKYSSDKLVDPKFMDIVLLFFCLDCFNNYFFFFNFISSGVIVKQLKCSGLKPFF